MPFQRDLAIARMAERIHKDFEAEYGNRRWPSGRRLRDPLLDRDPVSGPTEDVRGAITTDGSLSGWCRIYWIGCGGGGRRGIRSSWDSGAPKSTGTLGLISLSTSNICSRNLLEHQSRNVLCTSPYYASGSKSVMKATNAGRKQNFGLQGSFSLVIRIPQSWNSGRQRRKIASYSM